jgi:hypothetical protein
MMKHSSQFAPNSVDKYSGRLQRLLRLTTTSSQHRSVSRTFGECDVYKNIRRLFHIPMAVCASSRFTALVVIWVMSIQSWDRKRPTGLNHKRFGVGNLNKDKRVGVNPIGTDDVGFRSTKSDESNTAWRSCAGKA